MLLLLRRPKAIREFDAKLLVNYWLPRAPLAHPSCSVSDNFNAPAPKVAQISWDAATNTLTPESSLPPWVHNTKLVAKPDQLIKRRGKAGLLKLNSDWNDAKEWIEARAGKPQKVCSPGKEGVQRWERAAEQTQTNFFFTSDPRSRRSQAH